MQLDENGYYRPLIDAKRMFSMDNPRHSKRLGALRACVMLAACLALARPVAATSEASGLGLESLLNMEVVSASRFPQRVREAPASVRVIEAAEIRAHGWRTLADILDSMPGLFVSSDRLYSYLGVRGFIRPSDYNTNYLILLDGLPLNDNIYNQAYLGSEFIIDTELIDRVEFVPGPGSSVYGANAILGVVNVITRSGRQERGGRLGIAAGSAGEVGLRVSQGDATPGRDWLLSASHGESDGVKMVLPGTKDVTRRTDRERVDRAYGKYGSGDFSLALAISERERQLPAGAFATVVDDPLDRIRDRQFSLGMRHEHEYEPGLTVALRANIGASDYRGIYTYEDDLVSPDISHGRWIGLEARAVDLRMPGHKWLYGIDAQYDWRQDQRNYDIEPYAVYVDDKRDGSRYGVYAQDEVRVGTWLLNLGARYDRYSSFGGELSPRLALIHEQSPTTLWKLVYGEGIRAPSVFEMHYGSLEPDAVYKGNSDLQPERMKTLELEWQHESGSGLLVSASLFKQHIDDLITQVEDMDDGKLYFTNLGSVSLHGIEFAADKRFDNGARLRGALSFHHAEDADTGERLTHTPRLLGKLDLVWPLGEWRLAAELRHVGRRPTNTGAADAYTLANLALTGGHVAGGTLSVRVHNLFDSHYEDPVGEEFSQETLPRERRGASLRWEWTF